MVSVTKTPPQACAGTPVLELSIQPGHPTQDPDLCKSLATRQLCSQAPGPPACPQTPTEVFPPSPAMEAARPQSQPQGCPSTDEGADAITAVPVCLLGQGWERGGTSTWASAHHCLYLQVPQLLSAMGSLWSLWFGSSVLSVVEVLELLLDTMALALLLCCRWLRGSQGQPRAATRVPPPSQRPASRPVAAGTSNALGPSCLHLPRCCRDFSRSLS